MTKDKPKIKVIKKLVPVEGAAFKEPEAISAVPTPKNEREATRDVENTVSGWVADYFKQKEVDYQQAAALLTGGFNG